MTQEIFIKEFQLLPDHLKQEVLDFLLFLKSKHGQKKEETPTNKPYFGCGAVKFTIAPDFDEPLEDFKEYME